MNRYKYSPITQTPHLPPIRPGQIWIQMNAGRASFIIEGRAAENNHWRVRRVLAPNSEIYLPVKEDDLYQHYELVP